MVDEHTTKQRDETRQRGGANRPRGSRAEGWAGRAPIARANALTVKVRGAFLDALAGLCDVTAAAAVAGRTRSAFYALRRRDAKFAEQWVEALAMGYEALETDLIGYARGRVAAEAVGVPRDVADGAAADADAAQTLPGAGLGTGLGKGSDIVPAQVQVGLLLLARHHATLHGGKPMRKGARAVTAAETDAVLTKRLDQLARSIRVKR